MKYIVTFCLLLTSATAYTGETIDFNRDIRPILSGKCFACHGPDEEERGADLRLDTEDGSRHDLGGYAAVVPGNPEDSELMYRVTTDDSSDVMPPDGKGQALTKHEVSLLEKWIKQGGKYARHWAYEKPVYPEIPQSAHKDWKVNNPIDPFIHRRLASAGLQPSPAADRLTLARRVAIDITGLPPTASMVEAFQNDSEPGAYERYVERLLASPAFGERWAQMWLDLARYADSAGYADDPPRMIWAYRDWVIRAFNNNIPFDKFTIDQIAGDLLENPDKDQLIATAFHRNTLTNNEGGTNDEEFRNVAVVDRVNTTMEVWMGTTMACAQCHTHKYDPITQEEYFQMFDYFNQSEDADKKDESPVLELWTEQQLKQKEDWQAEISQLQKLLDEETPELAKSRKQWLTNLSREPEWTTFPLQAATGASLKATENNWIKLDGDLPENAAYALHFTTSPSRVTGLRLEVSAEQKSNFVLSQVKAYWKPAKTRRLDGQFVRIELKGKSKMIHLAEVEVFSGGENIALQGKASQSSTGYNGPAKLAIDGNTDGDYANKSVSHTAVETNPWFEIDLGKTVSVDSIKLWNRTGQGLPERLAGYSIQILDANREVVWTQTPKQVPLPSSTFAMNGTIDLPLLLALADYEQKGFPATSVLAAKPDKKKGWAVGGATGKSHQLTLTLARPVKFDEGTLTIKLAQNSEYKSHLLTDFRISATSEAGITEWARMPAGVRQLIKNGDTSDAKIAAYHRSIAKELAPKRTRLANLEKSLKNAKPETSVPVMRDLTDDKHRITKVQIRGNYQNTGKTVSRNVPAVFHPLREDLPNNRLALAHWLVDPENPLTARVVVNRFWEHIFGTGIVQTSEEFGSQGDLPSHPDLLDWLSIKFQESGWDTKALLRTMVTSATYRQQTTTTPEILEKDPFNRLYARGPRFRIAAEMVRDQALFVSGLLSNKMYGPPVKPPQPNLGLKAAFGSSTDWKTSNGEDRFRRGIYTNWRRSSPYPSMATFDAPNREVCTSRRGRTNTPLQALVTLNDPVYIEAAQALSRRIVQAGGKSMSEKIRYAWRTTLIREPNESETGRMISLVKQATEKYQNNAEEAKMMATNPIGPPPEGIDVAELAAWTVAANVLLNLDELFLKR
ncbi:MAG: DUF1553 domain-containing protein [Verrucomicrobiales bacterium]|nr:DUF1553 domain-containing protein [Verrucomicrobiales bacterium]